VTSDISKDFCGRMTSTFNFLPLSHVSDKFHVIFELIRDIIFQKRGVVNVDFLF
jgi:hypothetical protein